MKALRPEIKVIGVEADDAAGSVKQSTAVSTINRYNNYYIIIPYSFMITIAILLSLPLILHNSISPWQE